MKDVTLYANGTALILNGTGNKTRVYIDKNADGVLDPDEEGRYHHQEIRKCKKEVAEATSFFAYFTNSAECGTMKSL